MNTSAALHRRAIVIDGHSDILTAVAGGQTRLGQKIVFPAPQPDAPFGYGLAGQYSLPQWEAGGVSVESCAIYLADAQLANPLHAALEMVGWLHREIEENPGLELIRSIADIHRVKQAGKVGLLLTFEGFEPLGSDLRLLDIFYLLGLRMAGLTHSRRNFFADGSQWDTQTGGLTPAGKLAVTRMNELGIVIDLAHLNQAGFWEVLEISRHPVVVTHSSPSKYFPENPQLDPHPRYPALDTSRGRERLAALAQNGGVFGVIFYRQASLAAILDDISFLLDRVGPDHIGLGSDFYGLNAAPPDFADIAQLPRLTEALAQRGLPNEAILKILGGNYLRVFQEVWR